MADKQKRRLAVLTGELLLAKDHGPIWTRPGHDTVATFAGAIEAGDACLVLSIDVTSIGTTHVLVLAPGLQIGWKSLVAFARGARVKQRPSLGENTT